MVHALREAWRVLARRGVLVDIRPVTRPLILELIAAAETPWSQTVELYSAPEDVAAADVAVQHAVSAEWFAFEKHVTFDFDIYCDSAEELEAYVQARKLRGADIPYQQLEARRRELGTHAEPARLRCRRPWILSTYHKL